MFVELTSDVPGIINNALNEVRNGLLGDETPVTVCPIENQGGYAPLARHLHH